MLFVGHFTVSSIAGSGSIFLNYHGTMGVLIIMLDAYFIDIKTHKGGKVSYTA
jgi:hypothetical protein